MQDTKRLVRLMAMLTQLQTKRIITAPQLALQHAVSVRTIYRDIKTLEQAGIPILTEEGKGYYLMDGYRMPPIMFTENEANALITAEQLVLKNKDASFVKNYTDAIQKIKAILRYSTKDKADLLANRMVFRQNTTQERTSNYLADLQLALTNYQLTELHYFSPDTNQHTKRKIEPFALYSTQENWIVIAYCRLRKEFRAFRLDRIKSLTIKNEYFTPHPMSLQTYFERCNEKNKTYP
jgi:predicted DNA-binding transcriptional regulator YafY